MALLRLSVLIPMMMVPFLLLSPFFAGWAHGTKLSSSSSTYFSSPSPDQEQSHWKEDWFNLGVRPNTTTYSSPRVNSVEEANHHHLFYIDLFFAFKRPEMHQVSEFLLVASDPGNNNKDEGQKTTAEKVVKYGDTISEDQLRSMISLGEVDLSQTQSWFQEKVDMGEIESFTLSEYNDACFCHLSQSQATKLFGINWYLFQETSSRRRRRMRKDFPDDSTKKKVRPPPPPPPETIFSGLNEEIQLPTPLLKRVVDFVSGVELFPLDDVTNGGGVTTTAAGGDDGVPTTFLEHRIGRKEPEEETTKAAEAPHSQEGGKRWDGLNRGGALRGGEKILNVPISPPLFAQLYQWKQEPLAAGTQPNIQAFFQAEGCFWSDTDLSQYCSMFMQHHLNTTSSNGCQMTLNAGPGDNNQSKPCTESSLDAQVLLGTGQRPTWSYTYNSHNFCMDLLNFTEFVVSSISGTNRTEGNYPRVLSMSYGTQMYPTRCTAEAQRISQNTEILGALGVSILVASGDKGSGLFSKEGWNRNRLQPSFPASLPFVTAVGATVFEQAAAADEKHHDENHDAVTVDSESVDSGKSPVGGARLSIVETAAYFSGGGFCWTIGGPEPLSYQKPFVEFYMNTTLSKAVMPNRTDHSGQPVTYAYNSTPGGFKGRATPDISMVGVNYNIIVNGKHESALGTSASTPAAAGFISQLNNIRLSKTKNKTLGFLNPLFYKNYHCFRDITHGNNGDGQPNSGWEAVSGWDPATGLGSPLFDCLAKVVENL